MKPNSNLNLFPKRSVWNATGDTSDAPIIATSAAIPAASSTDCGCSAADNKKKAYCLVAGLLLGGVLTYAFVNKSA